MASGSIPGGVRALVLEAVDRFNREDFAQTGFRYVARFEDGYVYLDRSEGFAMQPMCRLRYTGSPEAWDYEVFRFSTRGYSPAWEHVKPSDGSLYAAMRAAYKLYPA